MNWRASLFCSAEELEEGAEGAQASSVGGGRALALTLGRGRGGSGNSGEGGAATEVVFLARLPLLTIVEGRKDGKNEGRDLAAFLCETKGELNLKQLPDLERGAAFTDFCARSD